MRSSTQSLWNRLFGHKQRGARTVPAFKRRRAFLEGLEPRQLMAIDVAVIGGTSHTSGYAALVSQLNDDTFHDFNATLLTEAEADTLAELNAYDVVVVGNSGNGGVDYAQFESALRAYVEAGGGVVSTGWTLDFARQTTHPDLAAVVPVTLGNYKFTAPGNVVIADSTHPVTSGVSDFAASQLDGSVIGGFGGSTILTMASFSAPAALNLPGAVAANIGAGKSVYLSPLYSAETSYGNSDLRSGMADRLLEQGVAWAAGEFDVAPPTMSAALVGGNLTITDTSGNNNSLTISNNGAGGLVITDTTEGFASTGGIPGATLSNGNKTLTVPIASITGAQIVIDGTDGDDTLTVDLTNALGKIVTFNGGGPTTVPGDKLVVTGGTFATGTLNHTNGSDGSVVFGANTINYTGLEPVDVVGSTVTDLVINLSDNNATPDDTELSISGGNLLVTSLNGSHESDSIALTVFTTVTINTRMGDDTLRLDSTMAAFNKALTLNGNLGADVFVFETGLSAAVSVTVNGNAGTNNLQLPGIAAANVVLSNVDAAGADGTETTTNIAFSDISKLSGDGTGSLTGTNTTSTWIIDDGATNTYATNLTFSGFKSLTGGDGTDTFNVRNNTAVSYSLHGGKGSDQFNLGSTANKLDSFANITVDGGPDGAGLTLHDQGNSTDIDYTLTATTFGRTSGGAATFTGLNGLSLNAGAGKNKVTMTGIPSAADIAGVIGLNFSTGDDTLDISAVGPATVDLGAPAADPTGFNANLTTGARLSAFSGVENIIASSAAGDQLRGISVDSTWTINDGGSNTYVRNSEPARTLTFTGMDVLQGGSLVDHFNVENNSATANYSLKGGGGVDFFNLSQASTLTNITNPISIDGEAAGANLSLFDSGTAAAVDYSISANSIGRTGGGTVTFDDITDLTLHATTGPNTINVTAVPTASGTKTLNGNAGTDTLDLTGSGITAVNTTGGDALVGFDGDFAGVDFTGIELFLGITTPALSASLDASNNLLIEDISVAGTDNSLSIERVGGNIVITDATETFASTGGIAGATLSNGGKTLTVPVASITGAMIIINGSLGVDTLTADLTTALGKIVDFNGGDPVTAPGDKLVVTGGTFATGTINHTNSTDGSVVFGANTINYTGLEPIDVTGSTITDLVINLPDNAGTPDDTELSLTGGGTILTVTSLSATHELDNIALAAFTTVTVNARAGDDTIRVAASMETFNKVLTLNGGAGADRFIFAASIAAPGTITVNGNTDNDTLDFSTYKVAGVDASVEVKLTAAASNYNGEVNNTDGGQILTFTDITNFLGNTAKTDDRLVGLDTNSTWTLDNTTDVTNPTGRKNTYVDAVSTKVARFARFEVLSGGSANDTFTTTNLGGIAWTADGNGGTDTLNLTGVAGAKVELANVGTTDGFDGSETTQSLTFRDINALNASGATTDSIRGINAASLWTINEPASSTYKSTNTLAITKFESLIGNADADTFTLTNLGAVTTVDGGADTANDTLNLSGLASSKVELSAANGDGFDGKEVNSGLNFKQINSINANGGATDSLQGINATATWTVNEPGSSKYESTSTLNFSKFEQLLGNNGDDTFNVTALGAINIIDGSKGTDTLSFNGIANTKVELTAVAADGFDGKETTTNLTFKQMNAVNGGAGANSLKGLNTASEWTIDETSATASKYKTTAAANEITFSKFQTLNGQAAEDRFNVNNTGTTAYTINAAASDDTLDFTGYTSAVEITLGAVANNFNGTVKAPPAGPVVITFNDVTNFIGSSGTGDKLNGLNATSAWTIDATAAGNPTGTSNTYTSTKTARFDKIEILSGGSAADTFTVLNNNNSPLLEYTLLGNGGTDKFTIGPAGGSLTGLKKLNVDGGGNTDDEITFNDGGTATDVNYELSATNFKASTGLEVTHATVEKITLNASTGKNTITVVDGAFSGPTTTIKFDDSAGDSTLTIDDTADVGANTWTVNSSQVVRAGLTIDYSAQATITNLSLLGGKSTDDITVTSTKTGVATLVDGGLENDKISVTPAGNLNPLAGPLTVAGGDHNLADTRTVFKGGTVTGFAFNPTPTSAPKGDTLIINDSTQPGVTKYEINNGAVSRTSAVAKSVNYSGFELFKLLAGGGDTDILATMPLPTDPAQLPSVVVVDGGGNPLFVDNRLQIKGSVGADQITIGDETTDPSSRSQFEVANIRRMWVEGRFGNDTIHNRTAEVPALLDGGEAKDATSNPALTDSALVNEDDIIISDAQSPLFFSDLSSVLLGNDGRDFLLTRNNNTSNSVAPFRPFWTTFLIGDYFINNNVPLVSPNPTPPNARTSRLQVVTNPLIPNTPTNVNLRSGESGDQYVTANSNGLPRNRVIARLDDAANTYGPGRFENMAVDVTNLTVIQWLQGRMRITISPQGIADELAFANYYIRHFIREPGPATPANPAPPAFPNQTYRPGGIAGTTTTSHNGGEAVEATATETGALVQNPFDAADVNGDGQITAFDALLIINELNMKGAHQIDTSAAANNGTGSPNMLDVTGDSAVTAMDALIVINRLNLGDTTARNADALASYFLELDELERASNQAAAEDWANQSNGLTDEALLALLAADANDGDSSDDSLGF